MKGNKFWGWFYWFYPTTAVFCFPYFNNFVITFQFKFIFNYTRVSVTT